MQPFLACSMAGGLDLCLLVLEAVQVRAPFPALSLPNCQVSIPCQLASMEVNVIQYVCVVDMPVCPDVSMRYGSLSYWNQTKGRNTTGTVVIVTCQNGYQPVGGHSVVTCNSQGHWEPNPPDCGGQRHKLHQLQYNIHTLLRTCFLPFLSCMQPSVSSCQCHHKHILLCTWDHCKLFL